MTLHRSLRCALTMGAALTLVSTTGPALATTAPSAATATAAIPSATSVKPRKVDPEKTYYAEQPLYWGACPADAAVPGLECAVITAPLDWSNPYDGRIISVAISRVKATGKRTSIILTNPGGPGGAGVLIPGLLARLQPKLLTTNDLVGIDPRGIGGHGTTPYECQVDLDGVPLSPPDDRDLSDAANAVRTLYARRVAEGCAKNSLTPYINTVQTAYDFDLVRALLRSPKANYVGYSYGSYLGARYAAAFPDKAGAMVLDSNTDWQELQDTWVAQPLGFQRRYQRQFTAWAARWASTPSVKWNASQIDGFVRSVRDRTESTTDQGEIVDGSLISGMYSSRKFVDLFIDLAVTDAILRNPELLGTIVDVEGIVTAVMNRFPGIDEAAVRRYIQTMLPSATGSTAKARLTSLARAMAARVGPPATANPTRALWSQMGAKAQTRAGATGHRARGAMAAETVVGLEMSTYYAVRCGDGSWNSVHWWQRLAEKVTPAKWVMGYSMALEVCGAWITPQKHPKVYNDGPTAPVVQVQSEFDAPTVYELSLVNSRDFAPRTLYVADDGDHGQYAITGNSCVDTAVTSYLTGGPLPASRVCAGMPLPYETSVVSVPGPLDADLAPRPAKKVVHDPAAAGRLSTVLAGG